MLEMGTITPEQREREGETSRRGSRRTRKATAQEPSRSVQVTLVDAKGDDGADNKTDQSRPTHEQAGRPKLRVERRRGHGEHDR